MDNVPAFVYSIMNGTSQNVDTAYQQYLAYAPTYFASRNIKKRLLPVRGEAGKKNTLLHNDAYDMRVSSVAGFPVSKFKYSLLKNLAQNIGFFYFKNYDINITENDTEPHEVIEIAFLKRFVQLGRQVLLSILIPGPGELRHAIAGILKPDGRLLIINTEPTQQLHLNLIKQVIDAKIGQSVTIVDVLKDAGIVLQSDETEIFCVTWMLLSLTEDGKNPNVEPKDIIERLTYMKQFKDDDIAKGNDPNRLIIDVLNSFKDLYNSVSGGRYKMRRKTAKKWIQEVVGHMKKGAFTKAALKHGETPEEYADDVLKHPKKHTLKTRRRAQFLKNIRKTKKSSHSRK